MDIVTASDLIDYEHALSEMEARVAAIRAGEADEMIWLLEHPPLYTAGTSAKASDLLDARFPVYTAGRGGEYTYHGPGQRVAYVMLDLKRRAQRRHSGESRNLPGRGQQDPGFRRDDGGAVPDIRRYVWQLEEWIIRALARFEIAGERRDGRIGIWCVSPDGREAKIAALGVRVRRWVSYHGVAINVDPDLSHFSGIVPCGIRDYGVTSMAQMLGRSVTMAELDEALIACWDEVFDVPEKAAA
ncbi:MAG: lipoate-protein ligase B [Rhodospirillales bacterium]|nr:lipoate-protein ligase B [Rhodospirillales bacterium]MCB9995286.1 lipoate-protein ligase B [Rhodospirillales bacterium]